MWTLLICPRKIFLFDTVSTHSLSMRYPFKRKTMVAFLCVTESRGNFSVMVEIESTEKKQNER